MSGTVNSTFPINQHHSQTAHLLMCAPVHFEVTYKINLWMRPNDWQNDAKQLKQTALESWQFLCQTFQSLAASVDLIEQKQGLPDMVFTANAAVVLDGKVLLSRFLHQERQGEEKYFAQYFQFLQDKCLVTTVDKFPEGLVQEGAGDCLWDSQRQIFWAGYGQRSNLAATAYLGDYFAKEVVALQLTSPRFYHLDVSLSPLNSGAVIYYPAAFTKESQKVILERVPAHQLIAVSQEDAHNFVCNLVNVNDKIILSRCSVALKNELKERGFSVIEVPVDTFGLAGGSVCCLTLRLDLSSNNQQ